MAAIKLIDMYKDFLSLVRKSRVGTVTPTEFTSFLNLATEEVISQMLDVMDLNQKFQNGLLPLRKTYELTSLTSIASTSSRYTNYKVDTFPTDCRTISRVVSVLSANVETKTNLVKSNEVSIIVNSVFGKPTVNNCYYHMEFISSLPNIKLYLPVMTYVSTFPKCIIEYYTTPPTIAVGDVTVDDNTKVSVFNKDICTDIVNTTARMYLENVQDARYQTFNNELKQKI